MLKRSDLDQIERFLMGATLQDAIKIVQVCQALTAECRLMLDVIDQRTEDFFNVTNEAKPQAAIRPGAGQAGHEAAGSRGHDTSRSGEDLRREVHATRDPVSDSGSANGEVQPKPQARPNRRRNKSSDSGGQERVGTGGAVEAVGGPLLPSEGVPTVERSDEQVQTVPVKKRRGRPRKQKE